MDNENPSNFCRFGKSSSGGGKLKKMTIKERIIVGGTIILLAFNFYPRESAVQEKTNIVAQHVEKVGNVWYVDNIILDQSFKQGIWNPKGGDRIDLELNKDGWVVGWKVRKSALFTLKTAN